MAGERKLTTTYEGELAGNELRIKTPRPPFMKESGFMEMTAQRTSEGAEHPPPRIDPPPLNPVKDNGLAKTPPMGWNSWNHFHLNIVDTVVRGIADAMVSNGMKAAGYIYVNIDDRWRGARDS